MVLEYTEQLSYYNIVVGNDYLEALLEWAIRLTEAIRKAQSHFEDEVIGKQDVDLINDSTNLLNKIVVINPYNLPPELRYSKQQLLKVIGGYGSDSNPVGNTLICKQLCTDAVTKTKRAELLGIIKPESLPDWAKEG